MCIFGEYVLLIYGLDNYKLKCGIIFKNIWEFFKMGDKCLGILCLNLINVVFYLVVRWNSNIFLWKDRGVSYL